MNSVLLFAARGWSQLAALILMLAAGRYLSITQFGEFTLAAAVALMLNQFMGVGTFEYVIKHNGERDAPHTAFWVNILLGLAYWAGGSLIAEMVSNCGSRKRPRVTMYSTSVAAAPTYVHMIERVAVASAK